MQHGGLKFRGVVGHADPRVAARAQPRSPLAFLAKEGNLRQLADRFVKSHSERQGVVQFLAAWLASEVLVHGVVHHPECHSPPRIWPSLCLSLRRCAQSFMPASIVENRVAHILRHANFPEYSTTSKRCLSCRDVATEIPRPAHCHALELVHLPLPRDYALACEAALCHPAAQPKPLHPQSVAEVVQRGSRHQRYALVTTLEQHPVSPLALGFSVMRSPEALVEARGEIDRLPRVSGPGLSTQADMRQAHLLKKPSHQGHLLFGTRSDGHSTQLNGGVRA
mmetsp:Transcript_765/g.1675  ORF Transcript_765/g.1675 Transcript_765/m.1675 type:complete len:280 (+) Transcript_765:248-1087(+)